MGHVMTARALGSDGRAYVLLAHEPIRAGRATPGDLDDRPGMNVLETSEGQSVSAPPKRYRVRPPGR
jgi:hypothetical protein